MINLKNTCFDSIYFNHNDSILIASSIQKIVFFEMIYPVKSGGDNFEHPYRQIHSSLKIYKTCLTLCGNYLAAIGYEQNKSKHKDHYLFLYGAKPENKNFLVRVQTFYIKKERDHDISQSINKNPKFIKIEFSPQGNFLILQQDFSIYDKTKISHKKISTYVYYINIKQLEMNIRSGLNTDNTNNTNNSELFYKVFDFKENHSKEMSNIELNSFNFYNQTVCISPSEKYIFIGIYYYCQSNHYLQITPFESAKLSPLDCLK